MSILYSRSLNTGVIPDGWKKGHVTPVYKKVGHSSPNNHWPITLTSVVVGKILESIIRDRVLDHLIRHSLLSLNSMSSSLESHVYISQLITTMGNYMQAYNSDYNIITFNFSKAFNTMPYYLQICGI